MIFLDKIENMPEKYDKVKAFIEKNGLELPVGNYPLDGEDYLAVSEYETKQEGGLFEGHLKYVDLQLVTSGKEYLQTAKIGAGVLKTPYDSSIEAAFYAVDSWDTFLLSKGYFIVLEPEDLHRGGVRVHGIEKVKKYVFKIRND